jgi:hypothetical protein
MAYTAALEDEGVKALSISGFAYTTDATPTRPKNMLMIIGKWDEYRERMTGVGDIEAEWMSSPQTQAAIPDANPQLGVTYGDFAQGTARRVVVLRAIHIQESHSRAGVAEAVEWMRNATGELGSIRAGKSGRSRSGPRWPRWSPGWPRSCRSG